MIESLVNSILGKLADAAFKKITQIQEVGDKVEEVTRELGRIQAFLKDADRKKIKDERQKLWVNELIDVAYDIEDVIDNALLLEVNPQENTSDEWAIGRMFKKARKLTALDKLSYQITRILARIDEISKSRKNYGINNLGEESGEETMLPLKPHVIPDFDDPNVVGLDQHIKIIVKMLLDESTQRRSVASIVGIGGLGKTTLVRKVYNSTDVKSNFDLRIWVTVSQKFELIDIVKKILEQIRLIDDTEQGKDIQYFLTQLYKSLGEKKYLVVLDDVWTERLWNHVEEALVDANNGSRVLITSRDENIAKAAKSSFDPYKLPLLSEEQGLELLIKKAYYNPDLTNNAHSCYLLDIARKLVKKCGGLLLALEVLGGLLSRNPPEHTIWSNLLQTMNWSTDGSLCAHILGTSYDDLPFALKFCFMYFAAFPEDYKIDATDLIQMWVAEGFIPQETNLTLEETGHRILNDLVQRSMVQVSERSHDNSIKICQVHDLLRDLAVAKAMEVNFFTVCSQEDDVRRCCKARRVAVHYFNCDEVMKYASPSLRALLFFESPPPNCSGHELLKVLNDMQKGYVGPVGTESEPNHIEKLTQLRYLCRRSWYRNDEAHFANSVKNMKFLQTLDLRGVVSVGEISYCIWDIQTLRHVLLPSYTPGPPSGLNHKSLQTLTGVRVCSSWETTTVPNLPNLLILDIQIPWGFSLKIVAAFLLILDSLVELRLFSNSVPILFDMRAFPFYQQLTTLKLTGQQIMPGVTIKDAAIFPIHLTEINLYFCGIDHDLMAVFEKLYNLKNLSMMNGMLASIKKTRCSPRGFPRLQKLFLSNAENLEVWEIEEGAMSMLQDLTILLCPNLQLPLGLQCLTKLRNLSWHLEGDKSANVKAEKLRNLCSHIPFLDITMPDQFESGSDLDPEGISDADSEDLSNADSEDISDADSDAL